jgi:hypothetical protein
MKLLCSVLTFLAMAASYLSAAEIDGTWKARFTTAQSSLPMTVSEVTFDLKVVGNKISGMAHVGSWPGDAEISQGAIEGDHFTFTAIGHLPWRRSSGGVVSGGYPKLVFSGKLTGDDMTMKLDWGNVMYAGDEEPVRGYELAARRVSTSH